jgi:hypothetical protein
VLIGSASPQQETELPTGEILRQLFRAIAADDDEGVRSAALAMVAEERAKNHKLLADDLVRILGNGKATRIERPDVFPDVPKDRERGFPLLDVTLPSTTWSRIVLTGSTRDGLLRIADENRRRDLLAASALKPTQRILFYGPPGCGKTLAAQVLATELSLPLVSVRLDALVSSYLGETAANLRRVFEFVERGQWVVLFDEFDALGKDRDSPVEHGELKRVVNALLQLMDSFGGESLLIAATNHEQLLDTGIWRRFDAVFEFPLPRKQDRLIMLRQFLAGFDTRQIGLENISRSLAGASGADVERAALDAARHAVLRGSRAIGRADVLPALDAFRARRAKLAGYRNGIGREGGELGEGV